MNMINKVAVAMGLLAALAIPSAAAPITMQVVGVDTSKGGNVWLSADGSPVEYFVGAIEIKLDGVPYEALCVDLFTGIGLETIQVNPFSPFGTPNDNGSRAAWLYANVFPGINTPLAGEALQLAIWDIIHDSGDGFSSGRVRANTSVGTPTTVLNAANQYLAQSLGQSSGAASIYVSVLGPTHKQALMSVYLGGGGGWTPPTDVPEPATVVLTGLALLGGAVLLKRRQAARG